MRKDFKHDIAIIGGGFAGISAALSAARENKKVVLIESQYSLGGLATNGLVCFYLPICDGRAHQLMYSIPYELFLLSLSEGYTENYPKHWLDYDGTYEEKINKRFECRFNPQLFALLVEKLLVKNNIEILYGSTLISANVKNSIIHDIEVASRTEKFTIKAKAYVDCTGDATLNKICGVEVITSPVKNHPAYWYFQFNKNKYELIRKGSTDFIEDLPDKITAGITGLDTFEISKYMQDYHQFVLNDYLKSGKESEEHSLSVISITPELRMTQRIKSIDDVKYENDHKRIDHSVGLFGDWTRPSPIWELPLESLCVESVNNLFTAGKCIGVNNIRMWNVTRVIPVCALSGEAAGLLSSSYCEQSSVDAEKIQTILKNRGVPLHIEDVIKQG